VKKIKYVLSLAFALLILYVLFKNQNPISLLNEVKKVKLNWILLSMLFGGWAYVSRGIRWIVLINALEKKTSKINSISAVSIGYFTNLFIPRAGEISRCTALSQVDKIPINKLFGTIIIERIIDFIFLFFLIILTIILKFNEILNFYNIITQQEETQRNENFILLISVFIIIFIIFYFLLKNLKNSKLYDKIIKLLEDLKEGINSLKKIKNKKLFWGHTINIWIMYFLMTYVCFFSMEETSHLNIGDGLFLLVLGGIGMVIPTPGGIGSYHAIVMIGLSVLGVGSIFLTEGGDPTNPALIFPTVLHVAQTLVAIIMGSFSLLILFFNKSNRAL